jgi:hypothetical protein
LAILELLRPRVLNNSVEPFKCASRAAPGFQAVIT